jgi:hypothetical protein
MQANVDASGVNLSPISQSPARYITRTSSSAQSVTLTMTATQGLRFPVPRRTVTCSEGQLWDKRRGGKQLHDQCNLYARRDRNSKRGSHHHGRHRW